MIEILQEETKLDTEEATYTLPRNIRQIGDAGDDIKVYIEDYVMTYIKQMAAYGMSRDEALILFGNREWIDGTCYYFVSGAIKLPELSSPLYNMMFHQEDWKTVGEEASVFFPSLCILGWALLSMDGDFSSGYRVKATQEEFFGEDQPVFIEYSKTEREEKIYLYQGGMMKIQSGHYIYYDKNEQMQNYMISRRDTVQKEDDEHLDHATRQFRMVVQEKREQRRKQKVNILLYSTAMVLALVIILTGITLLGNYEKMQNMEQVLFRIADGTSTEDPANGEVPNLDERLSAIETGQVVSKENDVAEDGVLDESRSQGNLILDNSRDGDGQATGDQDADQTFTDLPEQSAQGSGPSQESADDGQPAKVGTEPTQESGADDQPAQVGTEPTQESGVDNHPAQENQTDGQTAADETVASQESPGDEQTAVNEAAASQERAGDEQTAVNEAAASQESPADDQTAVETSAQPEYQTYVIKRGDTLGKINSSYYGDTNRIKEICTLNGIENPDNICYGQKIILPW